MTTAYPLAFVLLQPADASIASLVCLAVVPVCWIAAGCFIFAWGLACGRRNQIVLPSFSRIRVNRQKRSDGDEDDRPQTPPVPRVGMIRRHDPEEGSE